MDEQGKPPAAAPAAAKNDADERSDEASRARSDDQPNGGSPTHSEQPDEASRASSSGHSVRTQIGVGVIVALLVTWLSPVGGWFLGAADAGRDVIRQVVDYDAGKVDDLKDRIKDRPYWQEEPTLLDQSLELVEEDEYNQTATVEGLDAEIVLADTLVAKALRYDGDPTVVVGRAESSEELPGENIDFGIREITVTGRQPVTSLVLSLGAGITDQDASARRGEIVMVRGVLAAYGRRKAADEPVGTPLGYFVVLEEIPVDDTDRRVRPYLRAMGVELPRLRKSTERPNIPGGGGGFLFP